MPGDESPGHKWAATHLLFAVTALVTYIVVSDDGQSTADQDHTSDAQSMPEFGKTSLRDTAARMNKRLDQLRSEGKSQLEMFEEVKRFATPGCSALLTSIFETFGAEDDEKVTQGATKILNVTETGNSGTVTAQTGDDEPEKSKWIRTRGKWQFTCSFNTDDDDSTTPPTPSPSSTKSAPISDLPGQANEAERTTSTPPTPSASPTESRTEEGHERNVDDDDYLPVQRWDPCSAPGSATISSLDGVDYVCVQDDKAYGGHEWRTWQPAN